MSYEIQFTDDDVRRRIYGTIPEDQILSIEKSLERLADDPYKHSDIPQPPYRPVGRIMSVKLTIEKKLFYVTFLMNVDSVLQKIAIRRVMIDPPLEMKQSMSEMTDDAIQRADPAFMPQRSRNIR